MQSLSYRNLFSEIVEEELPSISSFKTISIGAPQSVVSSIVYDTTINTASDRLAHEFWKVVAFAAFEAKLETAYTTTNWATERVKPRTDNLSRVVWGTMLLKMIGEHTARESEQQDIVKVIENALPTRYSEDRISPLTLLRACAVGASISAALPERPHIYSAPGGRIVLDYAMDGGRFTAIVADDYVHLLGTVRGIFRDRTFDQQQYDLLEFKGWMTGAVS